MHVIKTILWRMRVLGVTTFCGVSFLFCMPVSAATCPDVNFPENIVVGKTDLVLNGIGLRKATFLGIKVYVAGLYLPNKSSDAELILSSDQSWRLLLHFVRDVDSDDIQEALDEGFESATDGKVKAMQEDIDSINKLLPDLRDGDRLAFTHEVGKGVSVGYNNIAKGEVMGDHLAATMLAIWIGQEPPNEDLKAGLLGSQCE